MTSPRNLMRIVLLVALMLGVLWTLASPRRAPTGPAANTQKKSCPTAKESPATCHSPQVPRSLNAA